MPAKSSALGPSLSVALPGWTSAWDGWWSTPRGRVLSAVAALSVIQALRLLVGDAADIGILMLLVIPVALVAVERGAVGGGMAGLAAYGLFVFWAATGEAAGVNAAGHAIRALVLVTVGLSSGLASQRLRRDAARQRQLADLLGDMVSVHDPEGRYVYVSAQATQLLGYQPAELIGTMAYDYFHPHDVSAIRAGHDATLEQPDTQVAVYRVRRRDGRYIWFETVSRSIRQDGEVVEILCSSRDVTRRETERIAVEEDREHLLEQIEHVLTERLIEPVVQPIVSLETGEVVGYEALARFPLVDSRPPNVWFEQAAGLGLREALELLAVERALELLPLLPPAAFLSINASPTTLCSRRFARALSVMPARRLVVELTEHAEIADYAGFNEAMRELRALGVRLAVDDAGAGFASLRHILDVRPDIIKLDMGLTRRIHQDPARRALARALCDFALSIDAQVIAEGIEERGELDTLLELGIHHGQGYLLGKPARPTKPI